VLKKSKKSPDIGSVSEDDPRLKDHNHYTLPCDFPPLNVHVPDQNGVSPVSFTHSYQLRLAASCPKCMVSEPQDNSGTNDIAGHKDVPSNLPKIRQRLELTQQTMLPARGRDVGMSLVGLFEVSPKFLLQSPKVINFC
jgi:hypothetical protein